MTTRVKICGMKTRSTMAAALAAGADYVGLVFFAKSPRNVALAAAAELAEQARGRAQIAALLVDPSQALVAEVLAAIRPDYLQLHGHETPQRAAEIRAASGCRILKAIPISTRDDANVALRYNAVAEILFDTKPPPGADLPGGNGSAFDWGLLDGIRKQMPFMLSGGLTVSNVVTAIAVCAPDAVDVSSGVESAPGEKDEALIKQFIFASKLAGR